MDGEYPLLTHGQYVWNRRALWRKERDGAPTRDALVHRPFAKLLRRKA